MATEETEIAQKVDDVTLHVFAGDEYLTGYGVPKTAQLFFLSRFV